MSPKSLVAARSVVLTVCFVGLASVGLAQVEVKAGYDLFTTDPDSTDLLGIVFEGIPLSPPVFDFEVDPAPATVRRAIGDTDTIVHRLEDSPSMAGPIEIELVALSLVSVSSLDIDGDTIPDGLVYTTLQRDRDPGGEVRRNLDELPPDDLEDVLPGLPSLGTMDIVPNGADDGGTFVSQFTVFADLRLGAPDGPIVCGGTLLPCADFDLGLFLESTGAQWSRFPEPGGIQIRGVNYSQANPGGGPVDNSLDFWPGVAPPSSIDGEFVCVAHGGHPDPGGLPTSHGTCRTPCTTAPPGVGTGCDGRDNDCNGIVDNCAEDEDGPVLSLVPDRTFECPMDLAAIQPVVTGFATGSDDCNNPVLAPANISFTDFVTPLCGRSYRVDRIWTGVDNCGNSEITPSLQQIFVLDTTPPVVTAPPDMTFECPVDLADIQPPVTGFATATDACSPTLDISFSDTVTPMCGLTYRVDRLWKAVDECGHSAVPDLQQIFVVDTTPPTFAVEPGPQFDLSVWPPGHGYVVYSKDDLVSASDTCGETTVVVSGCHSSQPENVRGRLPGGGSGDGNTVEDCVVSLDGQHFAVRSERLGGCGGDSSRTYTVEFTATDECGNQSGAVGEVSIEHDRSNHVPLDDGGVRLGPSDPPPWPYVHPTTYGPDCGS